MREFNQSAAANLINTRTRHWFRKIIFSFERLRSIGIKKC